jgi:CubicO group peptidase (beta-lactamase class C family)
MSSAHLQKIDRVLQKMIDDGETKGVLAAVARKGKFVYLKAFGEMDEGKPMEVDTIFRICSQSKLVTNVGLMMLFEEGLFRLNDPISKYIPEFKETKVLVEDKSVSEGYKLVPPKREITIRDLITHTSGLTYAFWGRPIIAEWYVKEGVSDGLVTTGGTMADNIKKLAKCPLLFHPGEAYEYGLNTDVLGYLIEILSGMSLDKFFEERIFKPLGMVDTYFYLPEEKVSRLAAIYESDGNGGVRKIEDRVYKGPSIFSPELKTNVYDALYPYAGPKTFFSGGAGLSSTIIDYIRFCQMLVNKGELDGIRVLSPFTVDFMLNTNLIIDNDIDQWLVRQGWYTTMGGITLENPGVGGYFAAPGSFSWGGYYRTDYEFDVENELVFILFTQRVVYMDQSEEFDLLRIISHGAILSK